MLTEIDALSDDDLAAVFKRLPLNDRLLVSEVCKRWRDISRMPWIEIVHLDLSPIPGPNIAAIVKQCPNLQTVQAKRKVFAYKELFVLSRISLSSVSLHQCTALVWIYDGACHLKDPLEAVFSEKVLNANWSELNLSEFKFTRQSFCSFDTVTPMRFPWSLPTSLKRLRLSDLTIEFVDGQIIDLDWTDEAAVFSSREHQRQLECLVLSRTTFKNYHRYSVSWALHESRLSHQISTLVNLRELFLSGSDPNLFLIFGLPKLEVLFLHNTSILLEHEAVVFTRLVTEHPTLRILVLTGIPRFLHTEILLPKRQLYPKGFEADPVPFLHFFVGKKFLRLIRFTKSPNAGEIHPITSPLPAFLDQPEIAEIFKDVWLAEKIRELGAAGGELWEYVPCPTPSISFAEEQ